MAYEYDISLHKAVRSLIRDSIQVYVSPVKDGVSIKFFGKTVFLPTKELLIRKNSAKRFVDYARDRIFEEIRR